MSKSGKPDFINGWTIHSVEQNVVKSLNMITETTTLTASYTSSAEPTTDARSVVTQLTKKNVQSFYGQDMACISEQFNALLKHNTLAADYLPISETSLFYGMFEGGLLCAMVNLLQPGTVDPSAVASRSELSNCSDEAAAVKKMQNRNLAFSLLQPLGVSVNCVAMQEFMQNGSIFALTSVLVQVLRLATIGRMNFKDHELLVHLFDGWSKPDEAREILATSREQMLLRWVNYQMQKAGTDIELKDLGAGLADCSIYANLLWAVVPIASRGALIPIDDMLKPKDFVSRAERIISSAGKLSIAGVITPEHIAHVGQKKSTIAGLHRVALNVAFLYRIFSMYPNISVPEMKHPGPVRDAESPADSLSEQVKSWCKRGASEETLIRWINSFGPSDPVQSIKSDLSNGSVLLQVWDAMIPGCVTWSNVKLDSRATPARRKFQWMSNCDEVMNCAIKAGINKNCCSPADIVNGNAQNILSLVFLMMRLHSQRCRKCIIGGGDKIADLDDSGLVKWFNTKILTFGTSFKLTGLGDPRLRNTNVLGFFGERLLVEFRLCFSRTTYLLVGSKSAKTPPPVSPKPKAPPPPPPPLPPPPEKSPQETQLVPKPPQQLQLVQKTPPRALPPPPEKSPQETQLVPKPPQQLQLVQKTPPPQPQPPPPPEKSPQQKPPLPGAGSTALVPQKPLTEAGSKTSNSKQMSSLTVPEKQQQKQQQNRKSSSTGSKGTSSRGRFSDTRSYTSFTSVSSRTVHAYSKTTTKTSVNYTKWSSGNRNAIGEVEEDTAQDPESANNGPNDGAWLFEQVSPVSGEELMKFSVAAILMFNRAGIVVYASRLGPDTDLAAYRSILLELNAMSMKKA